MDTVLREDLIDEDIKKRFPRPTLQDAYKKIEADRKSIGDAIARQLTRGNVSIQQGDYVDEGN